ncbi:hypothetical protein AVEN_43067-1 [Araneus ventricosus]|uniref:Uncharacterized protein n=1 Tax=Araneus ventricosus TaxID=182803 RepID=A0A4Y2R9A0_ARAVE|nr:hypothetical protein AVEN_43067-1 [Araneus ventricosus]
MTRTTPELAPPSPNFHATPTGGRLATTFDLACNRPHTRRIFSGIGFRAFDPPVPRQNGFIASIRLKQTFLLNLNAKSIPINNTSRSWSTDSTSTGSTTIHVSSLNSDDTSASEGGLSWVFWDVSFMIFLNLWCPGGKRSSDSESEGCGLETRFP